MIKKDLIIKMSAVFWFVIICLCIYSCKSDAKIKNIPDVSHIQTDFNWVDSEKLIFDGENEGSIQDFVSNYPAFANLYFYQIMGLDSSIANFSLSEEISKMKENISIKHILDTVAVEFSDLSKVKENLSEAFKYYEYHFPDKKAPNIYTLISEYANQTFIFSDEDRDGVGIGLDLFLGEEYPYQLIAPQNPSFSSYVTRTFNQEHMAKKVMDVLVEDLYPRPPLNRLIDHMIYNGKKLYILNQLLPFTPDSIIHEYTAEQFEWCENNELDIWVHLLDDQLLYSNRTRDFSKLVSPSPNSPGMPIQSPGRTANWMGWKIVNKYMEKYPETSLIELIQIKDAQFLLEKSMYKPPRR